MLAGHHLARTEEDRPLTLEDGQLRWAGPLLPGGPRLSVHSTGPWAEAAASGDLLGLDAPPGPVPPALWAVLAEGFVSDPNLADLLLRGGPRTPAWRRALLQAALTRGRLHAHPKPASATVLDPGSGPVTGLLDAPGFGPHGLLVLRADSLSCPGAWSIPLDTGRKHRLLLPVAPEDGATLASQEGDALVLWRVLPEGRLVEPHAATLPGVPHHFARRGPHCWVLGSELLALLPPGEGAGEPLRTVPRGRMGLFPEPVLQGPWLALTGPSTYTPDTGWRVDGLHWVNLDEGGVKTVPFHRAAATAWQDGALWLCTEDGLWTCAPGEAPRCVEQGQAYAVSWQDGRRLVAGPTSRVDEVPTPPHGTYAVEALPGGVAWSVAAGVVLQVDGVEERLHGLGELSVAWQGEVAALCFGQQVIIRGPEGERARHLLPFEGRALGTVGAGFVFGPPQGGATSRPCMELVVLSPDGRAFDHLDFGGKWKAPRLTPFSDGSRAHEGLLGADDIVLQDRTRVATWRPEPRPSLRAPPPLVRRLGEQVRRPVTINPRDDWPQPGCTVDEGLSLLLDGHYAGTTGVSLAPGLDLGAAATVVAHRCRFEGGLNLAAGAELWLVDCEVEGSKVVLPGATLVEL